MELDGVPLTNLDQPLFGGVTKRDLIEYLDAVSSLFLPELRERPLSVMRVLRGQDPFMQKNVPKYTPDWVPTVQMWAESSHREVKYALCNDRRTLLWFGNQRAVEYHPQLFRMDQPDHQTHLVLDLDPPEGSAFGEVVRAAQLVREALTNDGLSSAVKTSGSKGVHIMVPLLPHSPDDVAAATRAVAARAERLDPSIATTAYIKDEREGKVFLDSTRAYGATVVAAYSPRLRPELSVSFPVPWESLSDVSPSDFTVRTAVALLESAPTWSSLLPSPQKLPDDLVEEGRTIPVARVVAMHEGKRRRRAKEAGA